MTRATLIALLLSIALPAPAGERPPCLIREGRFPDPICTPGAVATTSLAVICATGTRPRRHVSEETKRRVFREYGLPLWHPDGAFEVDHLIPLELGGSNALANLWPEAAPGWREKDRVEDQLHERVCSGRMPLDDAQHAIAADWTKAGK